MDDLPQEITETPQQGGQAENSQPRPAQERQKTENESALSACIQKRQAILDGLKLKNSEVIEIRKKISAVLPALRGKGASQTMGLIREAERIEFSIATEAYTPKKEKELLKRLREINRELSTYKELDAARKKVDSERAALKATLSKIHSLEGELAEARKKCDEAYASVVSERREAFEGRKRNREEGRQHRFEELQQRVHSEKKRQYDDEITKYSKDYDDTVSMEEIVVFEKKKEKEKQEETKEV